MSIIYNEHTKTFKLDAGTSSYVIHIYQENYLLNLYYGKYIPDMDLSCYLPYAGPHTSFEPMRSGIREAFSMESAPMEYPSFGTGNFRKAAIRIKAYEGNTATDLRYASHVIYKGKPPIPGLPATYAGKDQADTLEITTVDRVTGAKVVLVYTAFEQYNVIARSVRVENTGAKPFDIEDLCSAFVTLPDMNYTQVTLYGRHADERRISRTPLAHGMQSIVSRRGATGHGHNNFLALTRPGADEDQGDTYGFNFVYSGSFQMGTEVNYHETASVFVGFNPEQFCWCLAPGEIFYTPETVTVYTDGGLGEMSRIFHRFYNSHLIRGKYKTQKRPLLINSWEAAYFDIDEEKLCSFAEHAKELGIEMLVMDDGWFGHRDSDNSSLGDWFVNERKLDLKRLVDRVHAMGLKFGIWYEPEMISQDSALFRAHPDWCLHVPGREHTNCREQLVLDMSRDEVVENLFCQIDNLLSAYEIDYVKWDFNRNLTEVGSAALSPGQQPQLYHRFVLGTYKLMDRLVSAHPNILWENCSGGGGRFDPGMLYYSPQIWCSDNTDPIDRLSIQFGTSLCYPAGTVGAHVSANARTGYRTKGNVAMWGTFGYELDPCLLTQQERQEIKDQIADYHRYYDLIHDGELYRLLYPDCTQHSNSIGARCAWAMVSRDKREALVTVVVLRHIMDERFVLRIRGLDPKKYYRIDGTGLVLSGSLLMQGGLNLTDRPHDANDSYQIYLTEQSN